jgi:acyl-CoA reductase-like NAD-dependent aldehyde dehydrogenase
VFEDADLKRAAAAAANGAFSNAGQICAATGRVLAHESVAEELAERIAGHARNYILGDPLLQGVTMGPLNNPKVAAKVREHVDEAVAVRQDRDGLRQDREVLRQERDGWQREAEKLYDYAAKLREVDERRFAPMERRPWWRLVS